jgi:riboflavin kinase/FMN adenylyltransferase
MQLVRLESASRPGWRAPAVTVGNFDGVHVGHQALVKAVVADARARGGAAVVLTFDPHPSRVLSPHRAPSALMTLEQKAEVLETLGVDVLAVLPFTRELSRMGPEEFAGRVLGEMVGAALVVVGTNFRFGRGRAGDVSRLRRLGEEMGFAVEALPPLLHEGEPISSSRVREALARGAVEGMPALLGRRYLVDGTVTRGAGRGRALGIPTANLDVINETLPGGGVYAAWARVDGGRAQRAVANIGRRPTFGSGDLVLEAHLLDFDADLYGRRLRVEFQARLREERAFAGAAALREQIEHDIGEARALLSKP